MKIANALTMSHQMLAERARAARRAVDATAGKGRDTLFLAELMPADSTLWAFDIQEEALASTRGLLTSHNLGLNVKLIHACHSTLGQYISEPIDVAMFNLGYLPGASHQLTTKPATTISALQQVISLLAVSGLVSIVCYPGHDPGSEENKAVKDYLTTLPQKEFTVGAWSMLNQINNPPILYIVEKIGSEG